MRHLTLAAVACCCMAASTEAQHRITTFGPEVRPVIGAYVPTGEMRNAFKTATLVGGQFAFELSESMHLVSSVSWTHGHNKYGNASDLTHIWQYDVGAEFNANMELGDSWNLLPFAGLGAGGRTYDYRAQALDSWTCTAGYGTLGLEVLSGLTSFRMEGRDYLSCYQSPITGKRNTRNDVAVTFGMGFHFR